ncbi:MAG: hypothetical protein HC927_07115 [Deltaproteobacteria bacterium]|nr:hypothetical protein [Deltaproteobacteria bacterium]
MLIGAAGVGKTKILHQVADDIEDAGTPVIRLYPPGEDLDGPASALTQAAASMREQGINGVLDPIYDPSATFEHKLDAFRQGLMTLDDGAAVFFDVPSSWSWSDGRSSDATTIGLRGQQIINALLLARGDKQILLASSSSLPLGLESRRVGILPAREFLAHTNWGNHAETAQQVIALLPTHEHATLNPLELRALVALAALGALDIRSAIAGGFREIRQQLIIRITQHSWLAEAFLTLGEMRFPVSASLKDRLLEICEGETHDHRRLLDEVLLLEDSGKWMFHPRLRVSPKEVGVSAQRASALIKQANIELARGWADLVHGDWRTVWDGTVAKGESIHHWAEADEEQKIVDMTDVSTLMVLGRRRSLEGDYDGAVQAFRRATGISPNESYAHEYLGYNLDRLGKELRAAEAAFRRAVELDPTNPWWNRRLIQALQRRGKLAAAWSAWLDALHAVVGSGEANEWLQRHLHVGVARGFLDNGEADKALRVLNSIERERWCDEFIPIFNVARHWLEAEELDASVFPEHLPFETRWEGPKLGVDEPRSWYPARVSEAGDDEVILECAEAPTAGARPRIFTLTLTTSEFRKLAALPSDAPVEVDQFVELHVDYEGRRRIFLHPNVQPLSLSDPLDLLQSWRR